MTALLWQPSAECIAAANMTRFREYVNARHALALDSYDSLYRWSVDDIPAFWAAAWEFLEIQASAPYAAPVEDLSVFPGTSWFPGARLNFAENLLRYRDERTAFVFVGETAAPRRMSYAELYQLVSRVAGALRAAGVGVGDRVAGYMPNMPETAVGMLAATAVGAVWSSCATDIGPAAAADRLGQIEPKVLFAVDAYRYKERVFDCLANTAQVVEAIPSIERVVVAHYAGDPGAGLSAIRGAVSFDGFIADQPGGDLAFEQLPFDHPAVVMFSSGTTGKPKCLVQSGGGILLNQRKELVLHTDLRRDDTIFYVTTASWMMWNWLQSALGVGATIVLFDGNPAYPDIGALWRLLADLRVTIFGTSASYIGLLKSQSYRPKDEVDLSALRSVLQTGSALSPEGFAYVYEAIKADLHFNSISGGTDINGCFALGSPAQPVYAGQLQGPGLGMKIECYDPAGQPLRDQEGELVCEAPAPSMPLYFWDDPEGKRYHDAYFDVYPGVWRHGDYVLIHADTGGVTFFGRSDAVLKPSGVRIGTAEIYNQVEKLPQVVDSLAIGQDWQGDQRILLFVKVAPGEELTEELKAAINKTLRENASPRHVPAKIIAVPDIPYTLNAKKVETAVTNLMHGRPVTNRGALVNPESLDFYEGLVEGLRAG
ncbi:MAG: acetoacetate--CoA ligase [Thermoleophilia bacterium]